MSESRLKGLVGKGNLSAIDKHTANLLEHDEVKNITVLPLNKICSRYENMYINDLEHNKRLRESIERIGQITPISVIPISSKVPKTTEEAEYYNEMKQIGCEYFISSGHRRFRARLSIALGKDIESKRDIIEFYNKAKIEQIYENFKKKIIKTEEEEAEEKKWYVDCVILPAEEEKEQGIYNDTNLTARNTTTFELIINSIGEMKTAGIDSPTWINVQEYIEEKRGINLTEKTIKNTLTLYRNSDDQLLECIFEGRLSIREAMAIAPLYKEFSNDKKNKLIQEIWEGNFKAKKYTEKKKKERAIKWTNSKVEELLSRIKMNVISIDEAIEIVKNNSNKE